ncbi:MAG: tRNA lysidine(34) synthetase TilS [Acetobacter sp.]|nr:tRNA lysidine(34) synthetase TilS [Acetobacter sp.]
MQIIRKFLTDNNITANTFAIGVSGGADSLALALMFKEEFPQYRIIALTVDHQLRPSSHKEALYVAKIMAQFDIEHHILIWDGEKPQTGIEEQARIARYRLLCDWCIENNITYLLTAHHAYDQAETFLMRLQRGSGLFGLSGMDDVSVRDGIFLLRPLLHTQPEIMRNFLRTRNIEWVEDESNQCSDFLRVKMRQTLPLIEKQTSITPSRLCEAAENLRKVKAFIEYTVDEIIQSKVHQWGKCGFSFDYTEFLSWHRELRFYILQKLLTILGGQMYFPEADSLNILLHQINLPNFSSATLGKCYIIKEDLKIWIIKEYRDRFYSYSIADWEIYVNKTPEVRGLKIPHKLRVALLLEKIS